MTKQITIAFDAMGFDNDISEAIIAARKFKKQHKNLEIILVGNQKKIAKHIKTNEFNVHHANGVINMCDTPLTALRKQNSSMFQAVKLVADNKADGVLSAGCTPCYVTLLFTLIKMVKNVKLPGFCPTLPTIKNKPLIMCDVGANINCSSHDLYNFALMANIYSSNIYKIKNPKIGIINIGTETGKGLPLQNETSNLLIKSKLNYVGFIEPRDLLDSVVDIAICDGYTGNLVLKSLESGLKSVANVLKQEYKKPQNWFGAISSIGVIKNVKNRFDYKNHAGAVILGLNKPAVKTHGSADTKQFLSALDCLYQLIQNDLTSKVKNTFAKRK